MGSKPNKAHQNEPDYNQETFEKDKQMLIFILLRLFYALIKIVSDEHGNVLVIQSILRDFTNNWDTFYEKMSPFFELFCKELGNIEELKIASINFDVDKRFVVHIELDYARTKENMIAKTRSNEPRIVKQIQKGFFGESVQTQLPFSHDTCFNTESMQSVYDTFKICFLSKKLPNKPTSLIFYHPTNRLRFPAIELPNNSVSIEEAPTTAFSTVDFNLSFEFSTFEDTDSVASSIFDLNDLSMKPEPIVSSENSEIENEQLNSLRNDLEVTANNAIIDNSSAINEICKLEESRAALEIPFKTEEETDEEIRIREELRSKLEEQSEKYKKELENRREQRRQKRIKFDEELREMRQEQKQRFATLINCILLKHRFEEKEGEWSDWINYSYRALVLKIISQFGSFQDLTRDAKNFEKLLRESPDDMKYEIAILNEKVSTLLFDLEDIFEKLAKVDENFKDVIFIRVLQKSVCDIASVLFDVYELLGDVSYSSNWYHKLDQKMAKINVRDVPTAADLKRICKNPGSTDYSNLQFPQWNPKSSMKVEELERDEEPSTMEMCENEASYSGDLEEKQVDSIRSRSPELQMESQTLKAESNFLIESKEKEKSKHVCSISSAIDCLTEDEQEVSNEENGLIDQSSCNLFTYSNADSSSIVKLGEPFQNTEHEDEDSTKKTIHEEKTRSDICDELKRSSATEDQSIRKPKNLQEVHEPQIFEGANEMSASTSSLEIPGNEATVTSFQGKSLYTGQAVTHMKNQDLPERVRAHTFNSFNTKATNPCGFDRKEISKSYLSADVITSENHSFERSDDDTSRQKNLSPDVQVNRRQFVNMKKPIELLLERNEDEYETMEFEKKHRMFSESQPGSVLKED